MDMLDRQELNRQLGLAGPGKAGVFIANILESQPNTSISALISEADLEDNTDTDLSSEVRLDISVSHPLALCHWSIRF